MLQVLRIMHISSRMPMIKSYILGVLNKGSNLSSKKELYGLIKSHSPDCWYGNHIDYREDFNIVSGQRSNSVRL